MVQTYVHTHTYVRTYIIHAYTYLHNNATDSTHVIMTFISRMFIIMGAYTVITTVSL